MHPANVGPMHKLTRLDGIDALRDLTIFFVLIWICLLGSGYRIGTSNNKLYAFTIPSAVSTK
jgi:hypothetical protein